MLAYFAYLDLLGELGSYRFCIWYGKELETRLIFRGTTLHFYRIGALRLEHSRYRKSKVKSDHML